MAQGLEYTCKNCDYSFINVNGGTRLGSIRTHFCFSCLRTTKSFTLYTADKYEQAKCNFCDETEVFELPAKPSCPLCGEKKFQVQKTVIID